MTSFDKLQLVALQPFSLRTCKTLLEDKVTIQHVAYAFS
jgi:hypothetical protein